MDYSLCCEGMNGPPQVMLCRFTIGPRDYPGRRLVNVALTAVCEFDSELWAVCPKRLTMASGFFNFLWPILTRCNFSHWITPHEPGF